MAGQPGREQASFASGELGDLLAERKNLKYYRSGLKRAENLLATPQGPCSQRPYTRQIGRRRPLLTPISLAGATLAAPSGGTVGNALDGDTATLLTTSAIIGGPHIVFTVVFPVATAVAAVDVNRYRLSNGTGTIEVQYQSGPDWVTYAGPRKLLAAYRSRRFCAPPAQPVSAWAWRIVVTGLAVTDMASIGEIAFYAESTTYAAARLRSFAFSRDVAYDLVLTAGHGDVYAATGGWLAGFALPHTAEEARGRWRQRLNTGLLFSGTRVPWRIFRENDDREWECGAVPLKKIPRYDFGDVEYGNAVAAVWQLAFINAAGATLFTITVDGEETGTINPSVGSISTNIKNAIEALEGIEPGITVSGAVFGGFGAATITFNGEGNEGPVTINSTRVLNVADAAVSWSRITRGEFGGEDIFSDARGWPRCGIFYQQRLMMAGAPGVPNAIVASETGDFYQLNTALVPATAPFVAPVDTDEDEAIEEFIAARSLMMLTSRGEYWISNSAISKDQPLNPIRASSNGCARGVPVVENEGAAVFADRSASVLCEFRYNEVDQTFVAARLSLLASHLVRDVVDLAMKRSDGNSDANILAYVQADGQMRFVTLLREQDVTAFARVTTDGLFRAVSVNGANRMTVLTERPVNGVMVPFVERFEQGLLLDQAVSLVRPVASATVTGLSDHEGAQVWAIAGDDVFGPFTVAGGSITLPRAVGDVTVGRWTPFLAETLPPSREIGPEIVTASRIGYHTVRVSLSDTTSVALGANGSDIEEVPLLDYGAPMDVPELQAGFTGLRERDGIAGDDAQPTMTVTQLRPGRITLRAIVGEGDP